MSIPKNISVMLGEHEIKLGSLRHALTESEKSGTADYSLQTIIDGLALEG